MKGSLLNKILPTVLITEHRIDHSHVFQGKRKKQRKSDPGEYFASASSSKSKNKLNYAFLKPQVVPAKEECKPSSSIR